MRWQSKRGQRLWAATSWRSRGLFFLAIFFTVAALGVLLDIPRLVHPPFWNLAAYIALLGVMAVVFALGSALDLRLIPVAIVLNVFASMVGRWAAKAAGTTPLPPAAEHQRLLADTIACNAFIVLGYASFIRFIHMMARGHSVMNTEVILAKRIHDALVPAVSGRSGHADYYGRSQASGAIGGDLVDVIVGTEGTTLYVADVCGHGVAAGVLMAMLKSAARTALAEGASPTALLAHLNRSICELGRPGTFATCALLHLDRRGQVHYALAGHLPILRRRAGSGEISELKVGGPPLGLDESSRYESVRVDAFAGDVFLIMTDGLTEVFGRDGREFGIEGVRAAFDGGLDSPKELVERAIASSTRHGRQLDDQTLLAVRLAAD